MSPPEKPAGLVAAEEALARVCADFVTDDEGWHGRFEGVLLRGNLQAVGEGEPDVVCELSAQAERDPAGFLFFAGDDLAQRHKDAGQAFVTVDVELDRALAIEAAPADIARVFLDAGTREQLVRLQRRGLQEITLVDGKVRVEISVDPPHDPFSTDLAERLRDAATFITSTLARLPQLDVLADAQAQAAAAAGASAAYRGGPVHEPAGARREAERKALLARRARTERRDSFIGCAVGLVLLGVLAAIVYSCVS